MTIRMAQESDIPELAQLYQETVLAIAPHYYSEEQTHSWASFATDSVRFREFILSGKTFLATDETGILGFAGIADDGHITSAYVRRDRTHADYLECSLVVWFTRMRWVYWVLDAHIMQAHVGI